MPELPEVEALRRSLLPFVLDQKIVAIDVRFAKLVSSKGNSRKEEEIKTVQFVAGLKNRQIVDLKRRAKNLIFELDDGAILLVHLKMTGQLVFEPKKGNKDEQKKIVFGGHPIANSHQTLPHKHTHIIFELSNGNLYYNDVRKFGYLLYYRSRAEFEDAKHFEKLGLEPLENDFSLQKFQMELKKHKGSLKKLFLEQKAVVGLGNIYADEVCFEAKVLPNRTVESLSKIDIKNLHRAIVRILPRAVELGGSSVANYLLADGSRGNYAREHEVYGRAGKDCLICGATLKKFNLAGRTTVFCPRCQK